MNPLDVVNDFETLPWHDAELSSFDVFRRRGEKYDVIRLQVIMYDHETSQREPMDFEFTKCVAFKSEMNLQVKAVCNDTILEAVCFSTAPWLKQFLSSPDYMKSDTLFHFVIS